MSVNAPLFYAQQFATDVQLLTQQITSKLQQAVEVKSGHVGEQASPCDQVGLIEANENTERFTPMPRTDAPLDRRWVLPRTWDVNQNYDKNDLIRQITDPKMALARAAVAAINRRKDLVIIDGLLNTNQTGKTGTTATTLPTSQVVSVNVGGAASKMNVAKLREAKRILMANDVDVAAEQLFCVIDAAAHSALLAEVQVVSKDYNVARDGAPMMKEGLIDYFFGFNFIHSERLLQFNGTDDAAGTSTPMLAFAKSGGYLGLWKDINVRVDERTDLRGIPWQLYADATFGATRIEEKKIVKVWSR